MVEQKKVSRMNKKSIIAIATASSLFLLLTLASVMLSLKTTDILFQKKNENQSIKDLEEELATAKDDLKKYNYLLDNFNNILLKTIYYGTAESATEESSHHAFTAFSLFYEENFYLITAGHSIEMDGIKYINFKFKPNYKDIWIMPELFYFENDIENNNDFAVFKDDFIAKGLYPAENDLEPQFILGNTSRNTNILKEYDEDVTASYGESGSPVLNSECRVVGVLIKSKGEYTELSKVINAIQKNLE